MHDAQVGIEVEDATHPAHDPGNGTRVDLAQLQAQLGTFGVGRNAQHAGPFGRADDALIAVRVDALDAGNGAAAQEIQHRGEIQRRPIAQAQGQRAIIKRPALAADRGGRHAAAVHEGGV